MSDRAAVYRPCVGIMLLNTAGKVWVGERFDTPGAWQMPQGGIDQDEAPWTAARRELAEEIGTNRVECLAESRDWHYYDLPKPLRPKYWGGRYRGQRQKWFACRFTGADAEIDIATARPEFAAWQWIDMPDLVGHAVAFKRDVYRALVAEFAGFARP